MYYQKGFYYKTKIRHSKQDNLLLFRNKKAKQNGEFFYIKNR